LSKDNGTKWVPFDGLPFSNVQRVQIDPADEDRNYLSIFGVVLLIHHLNSETCWR